MKLSTLKNVVFWVCVIAGGIEAGNLAFWLMNQPSTLMFYGGILIIVLLAIVVWGSLMDLTEYITKNKNKNN